ncbi:MAG: anthranilate phosphoribosyltransferase [Desulfobacula sp.]|nr:anthranilate phosphoribosyltransferase [Desulfobacula sp.]
MDFTDNLKTIIKGDTLDQESMAFMMNQILSGTIKDSQIGAFMACLATRKETFEELAGAAMAMRRKSARVQTLSEDVIDTCGTGGDSSGSFNISTATAIVVAGCGVTVAKHGNRSISSKCGSADVLEELGVKIDMDPEIVEEAVNEIGLGFLFAPRFHNAMRFAAKARKEVGIKSIFNMLGPLTNPAAARHQLLGVFDANLTQMFAEALKTLGTKRAWIVHGHDGLDEISICDNTRVSELNDGLIRTFDLDPTEFFDDYADPKSLKGGEKKQNAAIIKSILKGEKGPKRDIVLINAGAALMIAGRADSLDHGIEKAQESIDSKKAVEKLEELIQFTQENG